MNVVYSSSDTYAEICGISIVSLLENNKDVDILNIYIINNNISKNNMIKLKKTAELYERNIFFLDKIDIEQLTNTEIYIGRWNIGTFYRLYLSSILPNDINKIIYIDCDTIIRKSLKNLYEMNMDGYCVAAVDDCRSGLYRKEIGIEQNIPYVNNGFMLINLKLWRELKIEKQFSEFITARKGDLTYMDQAPLNSVLGSQKLIYELKPIFNAQRIFYDFSYKHLLRLRRPSHYPTFEDYNDAINDPVVVHFTPTFLTGTRPWQKKDKHKYKKEYLFYKMNSQWKDSPERSDDRKIRKKIMTIICKLCPKFILIPIMSYLHAKWYPRRRIKIAEKNTKIIGGEKVK